MQVGLIAEFKVSAADLDRFLAAAKQELLAVRSKEPGCLRFDVFVLDERQGRGAFVEVFADDEAAKQHRELPHFKEFFAAIETINVEWSTRHGRLIE